MTIKLHESERYTAMRKARGEAIKSARRLELLGDWVSAAVFDAAERAMRTRIRDFLVAHDIRVTRWAIATNAERASFERTRFGGECSTCGATLETEADFARHFVIGDVRHLGLGECDAH